MKPRVFISYAHEDTDMARRLAHDLRDAGAEVWIDRINILPGENFLSGISMALSTCDWCVLVLTPAALRSRPVRSEVDAAIQLVWQQRMQAVIPFQAAPVELNDVPAIWAILQFCDGTGDYDSALEELVSLLELPGKDNGRAPGIGPLRAGNTITLKLELPEGRPSEMLEEDAWVTALPIPKGKFTLGRPAHTVGALPTEMPSVEVMIPRRFWLGQTAVTHAQYFAFVSECHLDPLPMWEIPGFWSAGRTLPVTGISWYDAVQFCMWVGSAQKKLVRLPSEAEWERAARGPEGFLYPWGNEWQEGRCNSVEADVGLRPTPVGVYEAANEYGCLDMSGNVREWCLGAWHEYPYSIEMGSEPADFDTQNPAKLGVLRGGGYADSRTSVRCTNRFAEAVSRRGPYCGFRISLHTK